MAKNARRARIPLGTIVYTRSLKSDPVKIDVIDYTETALREKETTKVEDCFPFRDDPTITWLNITGVHNPEVIKKICEYFEIHPLIQDDISITNQRPKIEDLEKHFFIIMNMLLYKEKEKVIEAEQISFVVGKSFVISFQETPGDVFNGVRERIRGSKGKIRKMGSDYLAYALIDAVVDNYFVVLEKIGETIEVLEEELLESPTNHLLENVHKLKRDLLFIRKSIWPIREIINTMTRGENPLVKKHTQMYLKDIYDHTIQLMDTVEAFRENVSSMIDIYLSSSSNRLNETMKVLTVFSVIFIPLTFIVGLYGMNFEYFPEIRWRYGYAFVWGVMICAVLAMLYYFKRKGWV